MKKNKPKKISGRSILDFLNNINSENINNTELSRDMLRFDAEGLIDINKSNSPYQTVFIYFENGTIDKIKVWLN